MELENKQACHAFASMDTILLVNDKPLGGVYSLTVKDFKEQTFFTRITLDRTFLDVGQELVEFMRTQKFTFKLMNMLTSSGWVALDAELEFFRMSLSVENDSILRQQLVIKTPSFVYADNISAEHMAAKEEEDLKNLIEILKKNQQEAKKPAEGFIKYGIPTAVLPSDDEVDAVTKQAFDLYQHGEQFDYSGETKKEKKKKKKEKNKK